MRKPTLLLCALAFVLTGCMSKGDQAIRTREERPFPDPTLGTDNPESQWYKTQILASPSAPTASTSAPGASAAAPAMNKPARPARTPVPTTPAAPNTKAGASGSA